MLVDIPSMCQVKKCERPAQIYSVNSSKTVSNNGKNQYLKTCCRHTFRDLNK
jgi:hypothetical protein